MQSCASTCLHLIRSEHTHTHTRKVRPSAPDPIGGGCRRSVREAMLHWLVSYMPAKVEKYASMKRALRQEVERRWPGALRRAGVRRPGAGKACAVGREGLVLWAVELLREQHVCGT